MITTSQAVAYSPNSRASVPRDRLAATHLGVTRFNGRGRFVRVRHAAARIDHRIEFGVSAVALIQIGLRLSANPRYSTIKVSPIAAGE